MNIGAICKVCKHVGKWVVKSKAQNRKLDTINIYIFSSGGWEAQDQGARRFGSW